MEDTNSIQYKEAAVANLRMLQASTVLCSIISLAYVAEVFKQARTVGYVALVVILAMTPSIIGWFIYKSDNATPIVKHLIGVGYAIMYCYVLLTTVNILVFVYGIPMRVIITLYDDTRYILSLGVGVVVVNAIAIVIEIKKGIITNSALGEIQAFVVLVTVIYLVMVSRTNHNLQIMRTNNLEEANAKTQALLDNILKVSDRVTDTAGQLSEEMDSLKSSIDRKICSINVFEDSLSIFKDKS